MDASGGGGGIFKGISLKISRIFFIFEKPEIFPELYYKKAAFFQKKSGAGVEKRIDCIIIYSCEGSAVNQK